MSEIAHQPCPYPSCGSSDAFSFNTEGYGRCHACERSYPSREQTFEWAEEKYPTKGNREEFDVLSFTPKAIKPESPDSGNWVELRGVKPLTMEKFSVKTYQDRQEYIYPSGGIKVRPMVKRK